jgi:hypothetical protein
MLLEPQKNTALEDIVNHFSQYQDEIHAAGLRGIVPKLPIDIATLEKKAMAAWPESIVSYVQARRTVGALGGEPAETGTTDEAQPDFCTTAARPLPKGGALSSS